MKKEELLDKYFLNALDAKESERFQMLLETDKAFREQFEFEESVRRVIRAEENAKLKSKLREIERETRQPAKRKWFTRTPLRIVASVVMIISVGAYLYFSNVAISPEALYASYYEEYPNTVYTITRGDSQDDTTERKAFTAYEARDYAGAIQLFTTLKAEKQDIYIDFYLAQSHMGNNELENAIALFKQVIERKSDFAAESQWYLALTYLKNGDKENAVQQLKTIASGKGYKQQEASELVEKLD